MAEIRSQRIPSNLHRIGRAVLSFGLFIRFAVLGVTLILPLLGAASIGLQPAGSHPIALLGVGLAFHVFAYVLNDVVDLPIDRSEPRRVNFPLVNGTVTARQALFVSISMLPVLLLITAWLGGGLAAYLSLGAACSCITIYNLWGKRFLFPPLTDAVQGVAWAGLIFYGACLLDGTPRPLTWTAGGIVFVFILITNGVHGSLRDLENDLVCGVRSTAILFGARPLDDQRLFIPAGLVIYAWGGQALLFMMVFQALAANPLNYPPAARLITGLLEGILAGLACVLLAAVSRAISNRRDMNSIGMLHLIVVFSMLPVLFIPILSPVLGAIFFGTYLLPFLTHSWLYDGLRRVFQSRRFSDLRLGGRILVATWRERRRYPLTTQALRAGLRVLAGNSQAGGCESLLLVNRDQVEGFLRGGWAYTERRLQLLSSASHFPLDGAGVDRLIALQHRLHDLEGASFDQLVTEFYENPDYAAYQHLGQAFRNQGSGRQPFILQAFDSLEQPPRQWCDVGCGAGLLIGDLLERYPQAYAYGIDISLSLLAHARSVLRAWGFSGRFQLLRGDLRELPFPDRCFGLLLAMEILEHLPDPAAGLAELARLLAPGGWLIASVPVNSYTPYHLHIFHHPDEFLALLQKAGMALHRQEITEIAPGISNQIVLARRGGE